MLDDFYRICAQINLDAVINNIKKIKEPLNKDVKVCAVIKTDAYGHGAVPIARAASDIVDFYAVASIDEALNLRAHEIFLPILVLGYIHPSKYKAAIENDIRIAVYDDGIVDDIAKAAAQKGKNAKVHIKVDTGMGRIGIPDDENGIDIVKQAASNENIEVEGIFTHLFLADAADKTDAEKQVERFGSFVKRIEKEGIDIQIKHCANSAAAMEMKQACFDMVRLGIAMYGLYPSEEIKSMELEPALSLKSHIIMLKDMDANDTVGYGATFKAERKTKIATIPVGYGDGYPRNLSNKGEVLINSKRAKIAGRVCMDMIMVDVTDIEDVKKGDEVVLIGRQGNEEIRVEELSDISGIFNYEFVCDIGKRVPRAYYLKDKMVSYKDYFFDEYS